MLIKLFSFFDLIAEYFYANVAVFFRFAQNFNRLTAERRSGDAVSVSASRDGYMSRSYTILRSLSICLRVAHLSSSIAPPNLRNQYMTDLCSKRTDVHALDLIAAAAVERYFFYSMAFEKHLGSCRMAARGVNTE